MFPFIFFRGSILVAILIVVLALAMACVTVTTDGALFDIPLAMLALAISCATADEALLDAADSAAIALCTLRLAVDMTETAEACIVLSRLPLKKVKHLSPAAQLHLLEKWPKPPSFV